MPSVSLVLSEGVNRLIQVPKHPLLQMLIWYICVGAIGTVLAARIPAVHRAVFSNQVAAVGDLTIKGIPAILPPAVGGYAVDSTMIIVMIGTLLLTIPVSWGYMALAFALAGVSAAVRMSTSSARPIGECAICAAACRSTPRSRMQRPWPIWTSSSLGSWLM